MSSSKVQIRSKNRSSEAYEKDCETGTNVFQKLFVLDIYEYKSVTTLQTLDLCSIQLKIISKNVSSPYKYFAIHSAPITVILNRKIYLLLSTFSFISDLLLVYASSLNKLKQHQSMDHLSFCVFLSIYVGHCRACTSTHSILRCEM